MSFSISKTEPVLIYGGGIFGIGCAGIMLSAGYNIAGIIDINPDGVKDAPVAIYTPDTAAIKFCGAFVWICLANGEQHSKIARELSRLGFNKILSLPLHMDSKMAKTMIVAYNSFHIGNYSCQIPHYSELWHVKAEDYILSENFGFVTVRIHKKFIYTTKAVFDKTTDNPYSLHKTLNNPYEPYEPYEPLHKFNDFYFERFQNKRIDLYKFLETALYVNPDFFIDCPCACVINENGIWDLLDGNHRASFLMIKGFAAIPVRVRREEYIRYFREPDAQALMDYCKTLDSLPAQVSHPAFMRFPVDERQPDAKFRALRENLFGGWPEK
jgi:hypothetical protein